MDKYCIENNPPFWQKKKEENNPPLMQEFIASLLRKHNLFIREYDFRKIQNL